jgi:hypothetical protein
VTRRRFFALVLLAAIGTGLAIVASSVLRRSSPPTAGRPGLTLLVNLRPLVAVTPGTPLVFELSLGSSPSSAGFDVGSRWRPWHALVRLEAASGKGAIPWQLAKVGAPRSMHIGRDKDGRPEVTQGTSAVARLEAGRHVHTVTFAAGPEETARIKPGTYRLRGVLETPFWLRWGWRGRIVSAAATVVVLDPSQAGEKGQQLEAERLARSADFYVNVGRFADAHKAATSLTSIRPKEYRSYMLLGDASAGLDRRQEALGAYRRAMALLPPSYEAPTLLMERIGQVVEGGARSEARR